MRFSWFLALRYLKPKRTFLSIITVISIAGVALGVGVLIVVIAVMSGFEKRIKDEWLKVEPPLFLHDDNRSFFSGGKHGDEPLVPVWRELLPKVKSFPGVENASPFLNVGALMQQAVPKKHDDDSVKVDSLPPEAPPATENSSTPPATPNSGDGQNAAPEGSAEDHGTPDTKGEPDTKHAPDSRDASDPVVPVEQPAVAPEPAPEPKKNSGPGSESESESETETETEPEAEPEPEYDSSRPFTQVMLIAVDTDDVNEMEKRRLRFEELKRITRPNGRPLAEGEFDLSGDNVLLFEGAVERLYRLTQEEFPYIDIATYNVFGPAFLNEVPKVIQEHSEAKNDPKKKKALEEKDRDYPMPEELRFKGVFNDDKLQSGGMQAVGLVSLKTAQRLAGAGGAVDGLSVDLADAYDAPAMAKKIEESGILPEGWRTETWIERHRQQFEAVANERSMMYIVLGFISIVAAFCIMNTMITMAVQKRREIGMMRALGAKTSHIITLFMTKGFIVGLFGTGIGYGLGRLVLYFRNDLRTWINDRFGHQIFDSSIYGLNEIPAQLRGLDEVMICGLAFILCTLAAVPPAWMVGRMAPARALRNDR